MRDVVQIAPSGISAPVENRINSVHGEACAIGAAKTSDRRLLRHKLITFKDLKRGRRSCSGNPVIGVAKFHHKPAFPLSFT